MKLLAVALAVVVLIAACASHTGSSPGVPQKTIERAADTKIIDAGSDASDAG